MKPFEYKSIDLSTVPVTYAISSVKPRIKPLKEVLSSHPAFIKECQASESINTANITIPVMRIPVEIAQPFKIKIYPVADTGANINVIGAKIAMKYKSYLQHDRKSSKIRTAGGNVEIRQYLPVHFKNGSKTVKTKFYVLWDLPYDWLVGRPLIHALGWKLKQPTASFYHKAQNLDCIDDDLMEINHIDHLQSENQNIDINKVQCESNEIRKWLTTALAKYESMIAKYEVDSGCIPKVEFRIDFKDNVDTSPQVYKEYPHSALHIDEIERQLKQLQDKGFISRSTSEWRFPTFIVPKKTGDARIVFDFRGLNQITKSMQHPLPDPRKLMHKFANKNVFSAIDVKGGYWHIPVHEAHRDRLAFVFNNTLYQWNVMPFGPKNAPAYFQKVMNDIFADLDFVVIYMDDITIISDNEEQHKQHLKIVFDRIIKNNIKLRIDKCVFGVSECQFLGFVTNKFGIRPTKKYKNKILKISKPYDRKSMQRFLGLVNYLHRFIPNMHDDLKPLSAMTHKHVKFRWTNELEKHYENIKRKVEKAEWLRHPDWNKEFFVVCDASCAGIGGMLAQMDKNGRLQPVEFCSKTFNTTQQNWHVSEQEIYAVIYLVEKWRYMLMGKKFTVLTDHLNLQELFNKCKNFRAGKLYRWAVRLQDFEFEAKYIPGDDNVFADYLSRDGLPSTPLDACKNPNKDILNLYTNYLITKSINPYPYETISYTDRKLHLNTFKNAINYVEKPELNVIFKPSINENENVRNNVLPERDTAVKIQNVFTFDRTPASDDSDDSDWEPPTSYKQSQPTTQHQLKTNTSMNDKDKTKSPSMRHAPPALPLPDLSTTFNNDTSFPSEPQPIRHSSRLRSKLPQNFDQIKTNTKLIIQPTVAQKGMTQSQRKELQRKIDEVKQLNEDILKWKPNTVTHNPNTIAPSNIPIFDQYTNEHLTDTLIRDKQINDPLCFAIMEYLHNQNTNLIWTLPDYLINYVKTGRFSLNRSNILTFKQQDKQLIVVPASLMRSILKIGHNTMHQGSGKLDSIITRNYWWPKYRKDCREYCKYCDSCQKSGKGGNRNAKKPKMKLFPSTQPNEQVSIDIVGPMPMTKRKNRYIVTMIDKFTRYCMLIPVHNIKSLTILQAFEHWIKFFGPPKYILSDNGTQFTSEIFKSYNRYNKISQKFTTTYHPECNGQIERLHRWIKERLTLISCDTGKDFIDNIDDDWSDYLNIIQYTYNGTPNRMTSFAPSELMMGRKIQLPIDPEPLNPFDATITPMKYIKYMTKRYQIIHNKAKLKQEYYDKIRKKSYDKNKNNSTYQVGDYVLENISPRLTGNEKKLIPNYVGPYEITQIFNNGANYRVTDCQHGTESHVVSAKHLKPYHKLENDDIPQSLMMKSVINKLNECRTNLTILSKPNQSKSLQDINKKILLKTEEIKLENLYIYFMDIKPAL